jgi:hypothetical protein
MPQNVTADAPSHDPLKTVADALNKAAATVKSGAAEAKTAGERMVPGAAQFLSRLFYTTSYTLSYGVVFPAVLIARSIPADNSVVHGFIDGARAAREGAIELKEGRRAAPSGQVRAIAAQTPTRRKTKRSSGART